MPKCQQDHPILEDWVHYCIHVSDLGEGGGNQPPLSHAWSDLLIVDILQEGLEEQITEAVVLAPGEAILFFEWQSCKEGLPLGSTRHVGFSLMDLTSWAGRAAQVEATVNTVEESCHAIAEAVVEKRTKARGPGHPCRTMKVMKTPIAAYDIGEWTWGVEEDAPKKGV